MRGDTKWKIQLLHMANLVLKSSQKPINPVRDQLMTQHQSSLRFRDICLTSFGRHLRSVSSFQSLLYNVSAPRMRCPPSICNQSPFCQFWRPRRRGMEFLDSSNRLNVATSRAKCICIVVASPRLFEAECRTPRQMQLANAFCRYLELAISL